MNREKIREITTIFAREVKHIYGKKLHDVILYGSCARGDFDNDSDIDILVLLNVPREALTEERRKIFSIADKLDLEYEVVLAPVLQSIDVFQHYLPVSIYFQNIQREGVPIA